MELRMALRFMRPGSDFFEGVRAQLIDRDNNAKWTPSTLEAVTPSMVDEFFAPLESTAELRLVDESTIV
jgi:hypothetical protein